MIMHHAHIPHSKCDNNSFLVVLLLLLLHTCISSFPHIKYKHKYTHKFFTYTIDIIIQIISNLSHSLYFLSSSSFIRTQSFFLHTHTHMHTSTQAFCLPHKILYINNTQQTCTVSYTRTLHEHKECRIQVLLHTHSLLTPSANASPENKRNTQMQKRESPSSLTISEA
jgi:hypothetical protein